MSADLGAVNQDFLIAWQNFLSIQPFFGKCTPCNPSYRILLTPVTVSLKQLRLKLRASA